jgi:hypothetical protein
MQVRLIQTCTACPEQYDAYLDHTQIGYLRLRHGSFRADYPDAQGPTVYRTQPKGDGCFEEDERLPYLKAAVAALLDKHFENGGGYS